MRKSYFFILGFVCITGCTHQGGESGAIQLSAHTPSVASVNGEAVPQVLLEAIARGRSLDLAKPEQRQKAMDELTQYVVLAQEAQRRKFEGNEEFQADVELNRLQGVANATLEQLQKISPLTDEIVKAEYEQQVARAGKVSYDFSQLLFDKEDDAISAAGEVIAGKSFDKIFEAWKTKAKQARVYPQVRLSQLPEALAKALQELKPGETTKLPVKTEFGWHVINLTNTVPYIAPDFDRVKEDIRRVMRTRLLDQRVEELRKQAKILLPDGSPANFATSTSATDPSLQKAN